MTDDDAALLQISAINKMSLSVEKETCTGNLLEMKHKMNYFELFMTTYLPPAIDLKRFLHASKVISTAILL